MTNVTICSTFCMKQSHLGIKVGVFYFCNYKYLGNLFNNKGNNSNKIKNSTERVTPVMDIINNNTTTYHVGHLATQIRLYLVRNLGIPSVYHAAETWTNLTKVDVKDIEKIHKQMLTKMLGLEISTPYIGILSELGEWPIRQIIDYKRLMLLHNLMSSERCRIAKQVLINQRDSGLPKNWYFEVEEAARQYDIFIELEQIEKVEKSV